jgi:hypothetical protein
VQPLTVRLFLEPPHLNASVLPPVCVLRFRGVQIRRNESSPAALR